MHREAKGGAWPLVGNFSSGTNSDPKAPEAFPYPSAHAGSRYSSSPTPPGVGRRRPRAQSGLLCPGQLGDYLRTFVRNRYDTHLCPKLSKKHDGRIGERLIACLARPLHVQRKRLKQKYRPMDPQHPQPLGRRRPFIPWSLTRVPWFNWKILEGLQEGPLCG